MSNDWPTSRGTTHGKLMQLQAESEISENPSDYCNYCAEQIRRSDEIVLMNNTAYHKHCHAKWFRKEDGMQSSSEHHSPDHYKSKSIEPIDAIRSWIGDEAFVHYCRGNVIKYMARLGAKDESVKEARKAEVYARWMRETLEGKGLTK